MRFFAGGELSSPVVSAVFEFGFDLLNETKENFYREKGLNVACQKYLVEIIALKNNKKNYKKKQIYKKKIISNWYEVWRWIGMI